MATNDKISNMTAAVAADVAGSAGRIEMTKAYATAPVTLGLDFGTLRTSMFAGSTGYTATDPITAGAASFTTGRFSLGVQVAGAITPASGIGIELVGGAAPYLQAYNRDTPGYVAMKYYAATHTFYGGTSGTIVFSATAGATIDGNLTVGSSTFVVTAATGTTVIGDATAGRLSVGVTTPAYKLDILSSANDERGINVVVSGTNCSAGLFQSTGAGTNAYSVFATATGAATTNYGVYSTATGAGTNYSFYGVAGLFYNAGAATFGSSLAITGPFTGATTGAFSGDVNIGSGKFVVTAATGAVASLSTIAAGSYISTTRSTGNQAVGFNATNTEVGTVARVEYNLFTDSVTSRLLATGSGYTTSGLLVANATVLLATGTGGLRLMTFDANTLILGTNNTANLTILSGGAATFSSSLAITGALTGVTTAAISATASIYGATAAPATAGAAAAGAPIKLYSGLLTIEATTDAPTHTRPKGSLCINTGGSSTTTRLYVNTDGAGTWTPFTTSA